MPKPQAVKDFAPNVSEPVNSLIASSWQNPSPSQDDSFFTPYQRLPQEKSLPVFNNSELLDIAAVAMNEVYRSLKGNGFHVLLADEEGWVVESIPPLENHWPSIWSNEVLGTNAIGSCILTNSGVQVAAQEHFHRGLEAFTTSAVPLTNKYGDLTLVLGLIGPCYEDHTRVLSMLHKVSKIIMNKWQVAEQNKELSLYSSRLKDVFNLMVEGVVVVNSRGDIEDMNQAAARILGNKAHGFKRASVQKIFAGKSWFTAMLSTGKSFSDVELLLDSSGGRVHCLASGQASHDDKGNITGGMVVLHSIDRVHHLVNSVCGTGAELNFDDIIGNSPAILDTIRLSRVAADTMSNILLTGESGTGKEIFAQAIHNYSSRAQGPFVAINCGAIPRELIGSELFGYVEGAFTGARRGGKAGKFEMAAGGTLFLDEIGDMPLDQQVVLLRVLQEKLVTRIGDSKNIPVDVRIICASNQDLLAAIQKGAFRQDLYYRLNVVCISMPPLRDRKEDIVVLMRHHLSKLQAEPDIIDRVMSAAVIHCLRQYHWPGNVRELQNVTERLAILAASQPVSISDLPPEIWGRQQRPEHTCAALRVDDIEAVPYLQKKHHLLAEQESELILNLLERYHGNLSEVARAMGFSRTTLYRKLDLYSISLSRR